MKSVCVYLGEHFGDNEAFKYAVVSLGRVIAERNFDLIYGGSGRGLMGLLATTVKQSGGKVIGITTRYLHEKASPEIILDEWHIVDSMPLRKKLMQTMGDIFIVVPGGLGTLEEAIETWNAIKTGELEKPLGFLDVDGYFEGLFSFIGTCQKSGFLTAKQESIPTVHNDVHILMNTLITEAERI